MKAAAWEKHAVQDLVDVHNRYALVALEICR
jgi:hypothetical protein